MAKKKPRVWGLTGSIGMGKTTIGGQFASLGVPLFCSDRAVHELLAARGKGVQAVAEHFPDALVDEAIDRAILSRAVVDNPQALEQLEAILHPLVREAQQAFIAEQGEVPLVILDIPLLYETGAEARLDGVVVVSAPEDVQRKRVLARPGMTEEKFARILARQMPDAEKRQKAEIIIDTSKGVEDSLRQVKQALGSMAA